MHRDQIIVRKRGAFLCPANRVAVAAFHKLADGERTTIKFGSKRSVAQNQMYWGVLEQVVAATGRWRTAEELHIALKVATGHVDIVQLIDGRMVKVPGSIAFDHMNQDEAQAYYDAAFRVICDEVMGGMAVEDLLAHTGARIAA